MAEARAAEDERTQDKSASGTHETDFPRASLAGRSCLWCSCEQVRACGERHLRGAHKPQAPASSRGHGGQLTECEIQIATKQSVRILFQGAVGKQLDKNF